jgi:hypothetical protein
MAVCRAAVMQTGLVRDANRSGFDTNRLSSDTNRSGAGYKPVSWRAADVSNAAFLLAGGFLRLPPFLSADLAGQLSF